MPETSNRSTRPARLVPPPYLAGSGTVSSSPRAEESGLEVEGVNITEILLCKSTGKQEIAWRENQHALIVSSPHLG
jgi:hypothetical protein